MRARGTRGLKVAVALVVTLSFFLTLSAAEAMARSKPWEKLHYPELGKVQIPSFERHELANGMVVYLMEDHTWPLVEGRLLVHTGSVYEPAKKVGLASITGDVLRTGGTETMSGDELDETLESMGAFIESGIDDTEGWMRFSFLSQDLGRGLDLVSDVLRHPAFEEDKVKVAKTAERAAIARRNDELMGILQREIPKAVWGPEHPYARTPEYDTIDAITRDDLVEFYQYFYHPENMSLAMWGDFDSAALLSALEKRLADWPRVDNPVPPLPKAPEPKPRRVLIADKEDVSQTWFAAGHLGMRMDDPDYYSMIVMNRILGGSFGSRLFNEVRSKLGLAYGVGSSSGVGMAHEGAFMAYCGTKNTTVAQAMKAVLGEIDKIRDQPVSDAELTRAKEAMLNSYVFNFEQKNQTLTRLQSYEFYGYPSDFLEKYPDEVRKVDKASVEDVAKRRIHPEDFAIVAVGKKSEWDADLSEFGPVEDLDISIPEPSSPQFPEPTAETIEQGKAILAAGQAALGGEKLTTLKSIHRKDSASMSMQGMDFSIGIESWTVYPDRSRADITLPMGQGMMTRAVSPKGAWVKGPGGMQTLGEDDAEDARREIVEDAHYILGHIEDFQVQALSPETVGDVEAEVVLVRLDGDDWMKLYFDPASHRLLKEASMQPNMLTQQVGLQESIFSDWKESGGILYPRSIEITNAGEHLMSVTTELIEINPVVEDDFFEQPES